MIEVPYLAAILILAAALLTAGLCLLEYVAATRKHKRRRRPKPQ
jgi:hypothetical protein